MQNYVKTIVKVTEGIVTLQVLLVKKVGCDLTAFEFVKVYRKETCKK